VSDPVSRGAPEERETAVEDVRRWIETTPYARDLGVVAEEVGAEGVRLALPYRESNTNPGKALHGGCAASLAQIGAGAVARAALGAEAGPFHTATFQIVYLSAAIGEDVTAEARLLRRGKEVCFAEVDVRKADGRPVAHASAAVRGRGGADAAELAPAAGDDGTSDPGPMGPGVGSMPFTKARGITVERMTDGRSRLVMPWRDANADAGGGLHEGALLGLFDTTGAMAAWAETGPGRYKASTPALQAQILAPLPKADLTGFARVAFRDREVFWCDVEVAESGTQRLLARGTVFYRIVP